MGRQKLLLQVDGRSLLARALDAAAVFPSVVVVSPELADRVPAAPGRTVVVNAEPQRGMTHSLALADAAVADPEAALVVLLADTPFVDRALVRRVAAALGDADVAYPVRDGVPGHPVAFAAAVRPRIQRLADGDTLRRLRDDPALQAVAVAVTSDGPFVDVDTPADYHRLAQSG
jgi:molybdenum cofactor cytidylyltransferase